MKKVFLMLAACALTFAATAQTAEQKQQMQREWLQLVKNRNHVSAPYKDQVQKGVMAADTKGGTAKYRGGMPDNFWFPGEWEEVLCLRPHRRGLCRHLPVHPSGMAVCGPHRLHQRD